MAGVHSSSILVIPTLTRLTNSHLVVTVLQTTVNNYPGFEDDHTDNGKGWATLDSAMTVFLSLYQGTLLKAQLMSSQSETAVLVWTIIQLEADFTSFGIHLF